MTSKIFKTWFVVVLAAIAASANTAMAQAKDQTPPFNGTCPNGAPAKLEIYCPFFIRYNTVEAPVPSAVGDFLGITNTSQTRSIGLIIAIDDYPKMSGNNLLAAKQDGDRLQRFLVEDQQFDEVIVLRNSDASTDNIRYFLEEYLINHAGDYKGPDGQGRARLLIAYSGHGRPETPDSQAAFILSAADDLKGSTGIYKMSDFTSDVSKLSSQYFHVLSLVNACFGANVFTSGNTGSAAAPNGPGSFVITAGSPKDEAISLIPERGSLFFDLIVNGINTGQADTQSAQYWFSDGAGSVKSGGGLTLTLPLYGYLAGEFFKISNIQRKSYPQFTTISKPYFGPVQPGMAQGGFFFVTSKPTNSQVAARAPDLPYLSPLPKGSHVETASIKGTAMSDHFLAEISSKPAPHLVTTRIPEISNSGKNASQASSANLGSDGIPFGPVSSIKGHPEIKIFKLPAVYPIMGYDLSSTDGSIDIKSYVSKTNSKFIYLRLNGWAGFDHSFTGRWSSIKVLEVDRGAYVKYDFCKSPAQQLNSVPARLAKAVLNDKAALPVGVLIFDPRSKRDFNYNSSQLACFKAKGLLKIQNDIVEFADWLELKTGKIPLLYGTAYSLKNLTDARSNKFMIWLASYSKNGVPSQSSLALMGNNPWTLWQYTGNGEVKGVGKYNTPEVFFGTPDQYKDFRRGISNVALTAVMPD